MATSAFKSTTKRSTIGATVDSPLSSSLKSCNDYGSSNRSGMHRRSKSLSRFPGRFSDFSRVDVEEKGNLSGRFVNTVQGSSEFPEINLDVLADKFCPVKMEVEERESVRGRLAQRSHGVIPLESRAAAVVQSRGRSVSRHQAPGKCVVDNGPRRQRSVSVARYQCSYSESDRDLSGTFINHSRTKGIGNENGQKDSLHKATTTASLLNCQHGLRRSLSQKDMQQLHDCYSSCSSALTDEEEHGARCNKNGNEKTIRTVFAQQTDHPTSDGVGSGLFEEMRREVRHVVAGIRTELEQVLVKSKPAVLGNGCYLESTSTDAIEAIAQIRNNYNAKLEQSEKRTRELLSDLAIEEQRGQEFSKILRELLPEPKQSAEPTKPSRARKRITDRTSISKCLTEEAERYFEGFLSNVEDIEFSSFDGETSDASSSAGGNARSIDPVIDKPKPTSGRGPTDVSPLSVDTVRVVLPWLEWETSNDSTPVPGRTNMVTPMTSQKGISNTAQETASTSRSAFNNDYPRNSHGSSNPNNIYDSIFFDSSESSAGFPVDRTASKPGKAETYLKQCATSKAREKMFRPFEMDEYLQLLHSEDLLLERMKHRSSVYQIESVNMNLNFSWQIIY